MSSFGALLILISISENALKITDNLSKPEQTVAKVQPLAAINETSTSAVPVPKTTQDFSYLKFNVSDFIETEIGVLPEDSNFDYLKFDVNNYITNPYGEDELPSTDLDYLKFNVQKYVQNNLRGEINELPEE